MPPISLHEPSFDESDEQKVLETLRSSWVSTGGPHVTQFEQQVAAYTGAKWAVSTANGTVALQLMLEVLAKRLGISEPFDVLIPSLTFIATANAVVHAGGKPVLIDVEAGSLNIGAAGIARAVESFYQLDATRQLWLSREGARPLLAAMPVHIMGWSCPMDQITRLCAKLNLPIVEDAAEALGTFHAGGRHAGRDGLAAAISFNGNKIVTTGGGGMIITDDEHFARQAMHLSTTAKTDALRFVHDDIGSNFRMVNILAALGCSQMEKLPQKLQRKAEIHAVYAEQVAHSAVRLYSQPDTCSNNWLVTAIFSSHRSRERALRDLLAEGIQARPLWTPIHRQPAYAFLNAHEAAFPNTELMWANTLSLPSSAHLSDATIRQIGGILTAETDEDRP